MITTANFEGSQGRYIEGHEFSLLGIEVQACLPAFRLNPHQERLGIQYKLISVSNGAIIERQYSGKIEVNNGQTWGSWGHREMCPVGTYATGFSLKVEQAIDGDDTALNGIALRCTKPIGFLHTALTYSTVQSDVGSWGTWTGNTWCTSGVLTAFQLRVEGAQGQGDDTAANNIRFLCTGKEILTGNGMSWGEWGQWSDSCPGKGICGIQTKVELPQGRGDDTALNDVSFYCCS
ncbi:vitelline membrane outer layer protein 1-like [Neoarius graeffei]|uniref:vitelline membrane outer layer protein 1-like n=1 Tax=Neoarius graeffei TaxID=443677 RepID=UPI00298D45C2|nr:vitelline membrane outer layer protein 1-like [Neoarius graeffei]